MLGGPLFQVVLVLLFVIITMSAIVSSAQDVILQLSGWRTQNLRRTIKRMLRDEYYKDKIADRVYRHPMINGGSRGKKQLTYIEPDTFAVALATAVQPSWSKGDPIDELPKSVAALKEGELKHRLQLVLAPTEGKDDRHAAIREALVSWFNQAIRKSQERYKADTRALAYVIAAVVTVVLNVSPIEIAQRLRSDETLRTSFSSAIPELAPLLSNSSGVSAFSGDDGESGGATALQGLSSAEVNTMMSVFQCAESRSSLPIGWPWMAEAFQKLKSAGIASATASSCQSTVANAAQNETLRPKLAQLGLADGGTAAQTTFEPQYGPSFRTDPPLAIFAGWLLMVFAAAQGAPFWFNLIQRFIRR